MVRERFDESFERLREQSNRLAAVDKSPDNLDEILEARITLDRLRHEATVERKGIVSRFEPPAPDVVEPRRGSVNTKLFGKLAAGVSICLLVMAVVLMVSIVRTIGDGFPIELEEVIETVDASQGCQWQIEATLRNGSDQMIMVEYVETVLDRRMIRGVLEGPTALAPGETATMAANWELAPSGQCPLVDDVDHGNLVIHLDSGIAVSRGF